MTSWIKCTTTQSFKKIRLYMRGALRHAYQSHDAYPSKDWTEATNLLGCFTDEATGGAATYTDGRSVAPIISIGVNWPALPFAVSEFTLTQRGRKQSDDWEIVKENQIRFSEAISGGIIDDLITGKAVKSPYVSLNVSSANPVTTWGVNANGYMTVGYINQPKVNGITNVISNKFPTLENPINHETINEEGIAGQSDNAIFLVTIDSTKLTGDLSTSSGRKQAFKDWITANNLAIYFESTRAVTFTQIPRPKSFNSGAYPSQNVFESDLVGDSLTVRYLTDDNW